MSPSQNYIIPAVADTGRPDSDSLVAVYPLGIKNLRPEAYSLATLLAQIPDGIITEAMLSDAVSDLIGESSIGVDYSADNENWHTTRIEYDTMLPDPSTAYATSVMVFDGDMVRINLVNALNEIPDFRIRDWASLDPPVQSVNAVLEFSTDSGETWTEHTNMEVADLLPSEITIDDDDAVETGIIEVSLVSDAIEMSILHDATTRFRLRVEISDNT